MSPEFKRIWDSKLASRAVGTIAAAQHKRLHGLSKFGDSGSLPGNLLIAEGIRSIPGGLAGAWIDDPQR